MSITFVISPWSKSTNGWSMSVDANKPLSKNVKVSSSSVMEVTAVSMENQLFSFTVKEDSKLWDVSGEKRVPIILTFDGTSEKDQTALEMATLHYYVKESDGITCEVDRFVCYPLKQIPY